MAHNQQPQPPLRAKPRGKAIWRTDAEIDAMTSGEGLQKMIADAQADVVANGSPALNSLLNSTEIKPDGKSA